MMYAEMTKDREVNLMGMTRAEAFRLYEIIMGGGASARREFRAFLQLIEQS